MCETLELKDICEVLVRGCWGKGSLEVCFFFFFIFPLFSRRMNSHFCFMQSLWAIRAVFLCAVKLMRAIFTLKLYFLESAFWTCETWDLEMETAFTVYFSLSGRKVTGLQVRNWHKLHGANTVIPFPLWKTFPNAVGWLFYFSESFGILHMAHHICHTSLSPTKMLIGNYPAPLLLAPRSQFSLQHLCTCCESYPLTMDVVGACWIVLCERKLCTPHFQRGGMPSEEGRGRFLWITAGQPCVENQPFLLASYKLPTEHWQCQTHDVWILFLFKKKR